MVIWQACSSTPWSSDSSMSSSMVAVPLSSMRFSIMRVAIRSIPGRAASAFGIGMLGLPTAESWRFCDFSSWRISSPQNVWNTTTSQPNAAAVLARMSGGYAISKVPWVATMVIFFVPSSASRSATVSSSSSMRSCSSASVIGSPSPADGVSVLISVGLLDVVFVDVAVLDLFEQGDTVGPLRPAVDVTHTAAVRRQYLEDPALGEVVDGGLGLDYRHRAR